MSNEPKKTDDGTLDDKALDQVAGGNDGLGFLAGALVGGVVGGIAEAISPHGPNLVFAAPQQQFFPQQTFVQPAPVFVQQPQVFAPQQFATPGFAPAPVIVNSGW